VRTIIRPKNKDDPAKVTSAHIEQEVTSILTDKEKSKTSRTTTEISQEDPIASVATFYPQKKSFAKANYPALKSVTVEDGQIVMRRGFGIDSHLLTEVDPKKEVIINAAVNLSVDSIILELDVELVSPLPLKDSV
jgi:hypothetical protein